MDGFQTENKQMLALKQMYQKNKNLILSGLIVLLLGAASLRYWQYNTSIKTTQASDIYQEMLVSYYNQDTTALNAKGELLVNSFKGTPYYQAAALLLAKSAVSESKFDKAEEYLNLAIKQKRSNLFFDIAKVRLALVMLERGNIDGGLKLLEEKPTDKNYISLYEEAKGDLYTAKGDKNKAKTAYKLALESLPENIQAPLIQMKLIDLGTGEDNAS